MKAINQTKKEVESARDGKVNIAILATDGGARGEPKQGAYGFVVYADGKTPQEGNGLIGGATNIEAEFMAVINGLVYCNHLKVDQLILLTDSKCVVNLLNLIWTPRKKQIQALTHIAQNLAKNFEWIRVEWRERGNILIQQADLLVNEAFESGKSKGPGKAQPSRRLS